MILNARALYPDKVHVRRDVLTAILRFVETSVILLGDNAFTG
jgi:hypothetical protein